MHDPDPALGRRAVLRAAAALGAGALLSACQPQDPTDAPAPNSQPSRSPSQGRPRILIAYFSRAGEHYRYGGRVDLEVGNTEVLAGMLRQQLRCDTYRIEAADPYPDSYDQTVERNTQEQQANARPAIAKPLPSFNDYDTVLLGSGIWSVRVPMIMRTFVDSVDLTGKRVFPFVTFAVSGLGSTVRDYADLCPGATVGRGLAVKGEEVRQARPAADAWLKQIALA